MIARFFTLFFFLISLFAFAENRVQILVDEFDQNWKQHEHFLNLAAEANGTAEKISLFQKAYDCCHSCVLIYDELLNKHRGAVNVKRMTNNRADCTKHRFNIEVAINRLAAPYTQDQAIQSETNLIRSIVSDPQQKPDFDSVIRLYEEADQKARTAGMEALSKACFEKALLLRLENINWPLYIKKQQEFLQYWVVAFAEDASKFEQANLSHYAYELRKKTISALEIVLAFCSDTDRDSLTTLQTDLEKKIQEYEETLLSESTAPLTTDLYAQQKERILYFYGDASALHLKNLLRNCFNSTIYPHVLPLDEQKSNPLREYALYEEKFYRFFIENDQPIDSFFIKIYRDQQLMHEEKISLPTMRTILWHQYLIEDGKLYIPETKLKTEYGIELRLQSLYSPWAASTLILSLKGTNPQDTVVCSLDSTTPLFSATFYNPPPWQFSYLFKPENSPNTDHFLSVPLSKSTPENHEPSKLEYSFPLLDQLVEELHHDPILLAQYVQNEITLVDPFLDQVDGIFQAPAILRNPLVTHLEKEGSPFEQCQLLVYLLRKAGYDAKYVLDGISTIPKKTAENLLITKLSSEEQDTLARYPWVLFFDGQEWISLFPWLKEIQSHEGFDLYTLLPDTFGTADRWVNQYLKSHSEIMQHIGTDQDDTVAILFFRFIQEQLRKKGLSIADVGLHRTPLKRSFSRWKEFPRPQTQGDVRIVENLMHDGSLFAHIEFNLCSSTNSDQKITFSNRLIDFDLSTISLDFCSDDQSNSLRIRSENGSIDHKLSQLKPDEEIEFKVCLVLPNKKQLEKTLLIPRKSISALCLHFGGSHPARSSYFIQKLSQEEDIQKRITLLLSYLGATYFEKCNWGRSILSDLHKIANPPVLGIGITKFHDTRPQIDMWWMYADAKRPREQLLATQQLVTLLLVDSSANEHHTLREVFNDPDALSTVKLLQLAHLKNPTTGFLSFDRYQFAATETAPIAAGHILYPKHSVDLVTLKNLAGKQWVALQQSMIHSSFGDWNYAYITPSTLNGEIGTLILGPTEYMALISHKKFLLNGGVGSQLGPQFLAPQSVFHWQFSPSNTLCTRQGSPFPQYSLNAIPSPILSIPNDIPTITLANDVRPEHKTPWATIGDPVDVVTGAFYLDEIDLSFPGIFPLEIRRNYNSQIPLLNSFGYGWKLSLNPYLIQQNDLTYAAELDGTLIAYSLNPETDRWEIKREHNPNLKNLSQNAIGGKCNPFHAYIKDNILYGADGSKRYFVNGKIHQWTDHRGNILTFSYDNDLLTTIESSSGDFCGFHYTSSGLVSEIYAKDGRRIQYTYNAQKDLVGVTLPNQGTIYYEYDAAHRVIRESKPHGMVVENIYDDAGRLVEQRTPDGPQQEIVTTAKLSYFPDQTIVTDGAGGTTIYKIFNQQIYQTIDPVGKSSYYCWFLDDHSWFDPESETIVQSFDIPDRWGSLKYHIDKRGLKTVYTYDAYGNPIQTELQGKDLTGTGESSISKKRLYNGLQLCIEESIGPQTTRTHYDEVFPYLPKKIETFFHQIPTNTLEFTYDSQGRIIEENHAGSITRFSYARSDLPLSKIQITGTDDPDVITTYAYNHRGDCIEKRTETGQEEYLYDLMGNQIAILTYDTENNLLHTHHRGYNLNHELIWETGTNVDEITYFDRQLSGKIKAIHHHSPSKKVDHTLFAYDILGNITEEVDLRGCSTLRNYDAIGHKITETKEGHTTHFSYEPGGFVETICTPRGAKTTFHYTTNGLLTRKVYPDGSFDEILYDSLGRPISTTKQGITIHSRYKDSERKILRTNLASGTQEREEFDARGNLIRFIDAAGNEILKTYDGLNRLKTETRPGEETRVFHYQNGMTTCSFINGESIDLLPTASDYSPPKETFTTQYFDSLSRLTKREFVDGSFVEFSYDSEGNLAECLLPNGAVWKATYDSMGRKTSEELSASGNTTHRWEFSYEKGQLVSSKDPLEQLHTYQYDSLGRFIEESVEGWHRLYCYDNLGNLARIEQYKKTDSWVGHKQYHSIVERTYSPTGRILTETVTLNGKCLQATLQTHSKNQRHLQVNDHSREFIYTKGQLTQLSVDGHDLEYVYDENGLLVDKYLPNATTHLTYDSANHLVQILHDLPETSAEENLEWDETNRLASFNEQSFIYKPTGELIEEPLRKTAESRQDPFGRVILEVEKDEYIFTTYDPIGQVVQQNDTIYTWDPWGRLIGVISKDFHFEASYDGLGRRIQTNFSKNGETITTTSYFDPEKEFQEIGIQQGNQVFWKLYGPTSCDAVLDADNNLITLVHNGLDHLCAIVNQEKIEWTSAPSVYGEITPPSFPYKNLSNYAKSLSWHSLSTDPTGLIWIGARTYDPKSGRFLSPDPIGYPTSLDLYAYANRDPVNFSDPSGRFASWTYETLGVVTVRGAEHIASGFYLYTLDNRGDDFNFFQTKLELYQAGCDEQLFKRMGAGAVHGTINFALLPYHFLVYGSGQLGASYLHDLYEPMIGDSFEHSVLLSQRASAFSDDIGNWVDSGIYSFTGGDPNDPLYQQSRQWTEYSLIAYNALKVVPTAYQLGKYAFHRFVPQVSQLKNQASLLARNFDIITTGSKVDPLFPFRNGALQLPEYLLAKTGTEGLYRGFPIKSGLDFERNIFASKGAFKNDPLSLHSLSEFSIGTKRTYREKAIEFRGYDPGKNYPVHHKIPQQFRDQCAELGINVDNPKYTVPLNGDFHRNLHAKGYNSDWKSFFAGKPSKEEVLQFMDQMCIDYEIPTI